MWEAIAANRRRSLLLITLMGLILLTFGACLGIFAAVQLGGGQETVSSNVILTGGTFGTLAALLIWVALWLTAVFQGDRILLRAAGAREMSALDDGRLGNVVDEMTIAAQLPRKPRVYLVEDPSPNAFAVGRKPENAAVAVTSGLLRLLNRDELQGVVAHEIAHIHNLDVRFMTMASVLVAGVELMSRGVLRGLVHGGGGRRTGGSRKGGGLPLLVIVVVFAILAPVAVRLLYLACSRWREYLADACAARFTRYPDGLASALEKISVDTSSLRPEKTAGALAPLYIINPLEKLSLAGLFATHPPTQNRIMILRGMGGRAGYVDYEAALRKVEGQKLRLTALEAAARADESVEARGPSAEPEPREKSIERAQKVNDLLDRFANYLILPCACGIRIKVPPNLERDEISCSRCDRVHVIPHAKRVQEAIAGVAVLGQALAGAKAVEAKAAALRYERREEGWEAFRCECGQTIQLGPGFPLDYTVCVACNRRIELKAGREKNDPEVVVNPSS
ncbi:MAG: M48 family metallopeptidase [Acidobacteria bacterium]|nr:M48 family metallopeptidase [Acidobacteriota bacterium]